MLFILLGCWVPFLSLLTTACPAINQFLYYYALWQNFMQSNTSSKQATTVLVNKTIFTSEALGWDGCITCYPNQLKQPCLNFRKKLNLLLHEKETLLYTLSLQVHKSLPKCSSENQMAITIWPHHNCLPQNSVFSKGLPRSPTKCKI